MRLIKTYKLFNESFEDKSVLYKETNYAEYKDKFHKTKHVKINNEQVFDMLDKIGIILTNDQIVIKSFEYGEYFQDHDEYFYVYNDKSIKYYKCDGLTGFINCLKDKFTYYT